MRHAHLLALAAALTCVNARPTLAADEKASPRKIAFTDPAKADADFAFQGEYVGDGKPGGQIGTQVMARGNGKFQIVLFPAGLPGDANPSAKSPATELVDGELKDGVVIIMGKASGHGPTQKLSNVGVVGHIKDGVLTYNNANSDFQATLKKVERRSPTLGAKPPEGALVLFDGTSGDKFNGGMGQVEDHLLLPRADSDFKHQDCSVHVEFQVPYMPHEKALARGNSGVFLQGRYEIQILDSFGSISSRDFDLLNAAPANGACGAVNRIQAPALNVCYPPLAWQTYDIDFTAAKYDAQGQKTANARVSVKHNGVLVQDNVEIPEATISAPWKEGPEPGPLNLQDHNDPIRFRNIWLVVKR